MRPEDGSNSSTGLAFRRVSMPGLTGMRRAGPSGAGKTAVMQTCCTLMVPMRPFGGPLPKSMSV